MNSKISFEIDYSPEIFDIEYQVIGLCIFDATILEYCAVHLQPEDFRGTQNREIYEIILDLYQSGELVALHTIFFRLRKKEHNSITQVYIASFAQNLIYSGAFNVPEMVLNLKKYRKAKELGLVGKSLSELYKNPDKYDNVVSSAENVLQQISDIEIDDKDLSKVTQNLDAIEKEFSNPTRVEGISSGYCNVDDITGGFRPGELIILAARPSVGKTALSLNFAYNFVSSFPKKKVAFFSLEMNRERLVKRLIHKISGVPKEQIREYPEKIKKAFQTISDSYLYIDDKARTTPTEITLKAKRLHKKIGLDVVIVDYLQLLEVINPSAYKTTNDKIAYVSRQLKLLAKELECPVIALSQLSRAYENRRNYKNKRDDEVAKSDPVPMLSDLRDSGAIEQDADMVMFIYNSGEFSDTMVKQNILVAKNRNFRIGQVTLYLWPETQNYVMGEG